MHSVSKQAEELLRASEVNFAEAPDSFVKAGDCLKEARNINGQSRKTLRSAVGGRNKKSSKRANGSKAGNKRD